MTARITWDSAKAAGNLRKHHIGFQIAARVFSDRFALSELDRIEAGEYRRQTIGSVEGGVVLLVAHVTTDHDGEPEIIRIVSARRATRTDRRRNEQEKHRQLRV